MSPRAGLGVEWVGTSGEFASPSLEKYQTTHAAVLGGADFELNPLGGVVLSLAASGWVNKDDPARYPSERAHDEWVRSFGVALAATWYRR